MKTYKLRDVLKNIEFINIPLKSIGLSDSVRTGTSFNSNDFLETGTPLIKINNIKQNKIDTQKCSYVRSIKSKDNLTQLDDVLVAMRGATSGKLGVIDKASVDFFYVGSIGNFGKLNRDLIYEPYLKYIEYQIIQRLVYEMGGTAIPMITKSYLENVRITIPKTIEQQEKIYKYLESEIAQVKILQSLISSQLDLLKKYRQAILQDAIQGKLVKQDKNDEPASVLLEKIKKEKQKLITEGKLKADKELTPIHPDEVQFEIPKNWVWCRLGDVAESCLGKMLDGNKNKGTYQYYLRNINVRWGNFDLSNLLKMKFETDEKERFSIKKGDLVICEGGEPGRAAIWTSDEDIKFQKALHRVRVIDNLLNNKYLYYYIVYLAKSFLLEKYFTGATIQHFTGKVLIKLSIPLPPLAEQKRIVARVDELMALCDAMEEKLKEDKALSEKMMEAVLQEAFGVKDNDIIRQDVKKR
jgi:type I restriction enzyme S subunit